MTPFPHQYIDRNLVIAGVRQAPQSGLDNTYTPPGSPPMKPGAPGQNTWREGVTDTTGEYGPDIPSFEMDDAPTQTLSYTPRGKAVQALIPFNWQTVLGFTIDAYTICNNQQPTKVDSTSFSFEVTGTPAGNHSNLALFWQTGRSLDLE